MNSKCQGIRDSCTCIAFRFQNREVLWRRTFVNRPLAIGLFEQSPRLRSLTNPTGKVRESCIVPELNRIPTRGCGCDISSVLKTPCCESNEGTIKGNSQPCGSQCFRKVSEMLVMLHCFFHLGTTHVIFFINSNRQISPNIRITIKVWKNYCNF
jgi:hypothetical protein